MMKKFILIFLSIICGFLMAACSDERIEKQDSSVPVQEDITESPSNNQTEDGQNIDQTMGDTNILIAYFSRVGNTNFDEDIDAVSSASLNQDGNSLSGNAELLARMVQEETGGDIFLIETAEKYPSDYDETTEVAAQEQDEDTRPELISHVENMDQYDTVILIYPIWWGTLPQPVFTFLEEYDFSGKKILPLSTHEGSGMGRSEEDIAETVRDAELLEGLAVRGASVEDARKEISDWIQNMGIVAEYPSPDE